MAVSKTVLNALQQSAVANECTFVIADVGSSDNAVRGQILLCDKGYASINCSSGTTKPVYERTVLSNGVTILSGLDATWKRKSASDLVTADTRPAWASAGVFTAANGNVLVKGAGPNGTESYYVANQFVANAIYERYHGRSMGPTGSLWAMAVGYCSSQGLDIDPSRDIDVEWNGSGSGTQPSLMIRGGLTYGAALIIRTVGWIADNPNGISHLMTISVPIRASENVVVFLYPAFKAADIEYPQLTFRGIAEPDGYKWCTSPVSNATSTAFYCVSSMPGLNFRIDSIQNMVLVAPGVYTTSGTISSSAAKYIDTDEFSRVFNNRDVTKRMELSTDDAKKYAAQWTDAPAKLYWFNVPEGVSCDVSLKDLTLYKDYERKMQKACKVVNWDSVRTGYMGLSVSQVQSKIDQEGTLTEIFVSSKMANRYAPSVPAETFCTASLSTRTDSNGVSINTIIVSGRMNSNRVVNMNDRPTPDDVTWLGTWFKYATTATVDKVVMQWFGDDVTGALSSASAEKVDNSSFKAAGQELTAEPYGASSSGVLDSSTTDERIKLIAANVTVYRSLKGNLQQISSVYTLDKCNACIAVSEHGDV